MARDTRRIETSLGVEAAGQWGMFTAAQAIRLGLTRDRLAQLVSAERIVHTDTRGVYRFAGAPADILLDAVRAAWLALTPSRFAGERLRGMYSGGDEAAVSHVTAAHYVYELGTLQPDRLDFTVRSARRSSNGMVSFHVAEAVDWHVIGGLPVTTIPRTVADIYREGVDVGHFGDILADALATAAVDVQAVISALDPCTEYGGRDFVLHALSSAGAPESLVAGSELLFAGRR